jgi:hypothetical protein
LIAYRDVLRKEQLVTVKLKTTESYEVWVETPGTVKFDLNKLIVQTRKLCISRIVVYVFHPSYILRFNQKSSATVKMDNGCNFAAALAGMANVLAYDYYTKTYCPLYQKVYSLRIS